MGIIIATALGAGRATATASGETAPAYLGGRRVADGSGERPAGSGHEQDKRGHQARGDEAGAPLARFAARRDPGHQPLLGG